MLYLYLQLIGLGRELRSASYISFLVSSQPDPIDNVCTQETLRLKHEQLVVGFERHDHSSGYRLVDEAFRRQIMINELNGCNVVRSL
jgi:hypothetical protein